MTGLEAIKYLNDTCVNFLDRTKELYCTVTFTRKRAEILRDNIAEVEKSLKALEVIKKKTVDIWLIQNKKTLKQYNSMVDESRQLTEEEFNLLKEILE